MYGNAVTSPVRVLRDLIGRLGDAGASIVRFANGLTVEQWQAQPSIHALLANDALRIEGVAVEVDSFYAGRDLGGGRFVWRAGHDKARANGGTVIDPDTLGGFDGTPATRDAYLAAQGAGEGVGCWLRVERETVPIEAFGAVGDDAIDDAPAFQKAVDVIPEGFVKQDFLVDAGANIKLREAVYRFASVVRVQRAIRLCGPATANGQRIRAFIDCDTDVGGFQVDSRWQSKDGTDANGAMFEDFGLSGSGAADIDGATSIGIDCTTKPIIRGLGIRGFGSHGIQIDATLAADGSERQGNASRWQVIDTACTYNGGSGLRLGGGDVNAGYSQGCNFKRNGSNDGGDGITDSSFLGNDHIANHYAGNVGQCFRATNPNAVVRIIGGYMEVGKGELTFRSIAFHVFKGSTETITGGTVYAHSGNRLSEVRSRSIVSGVGSNSSSSGIYAVNASASSGRRAGVSYRFGGVQEDGAPTANEKFRTYAENAGGAQRTRFRFDYLDTTSTDGADENAEWKTALYLFNANWESAINPGDDDYARLGAAELRFKDLYVSNSPIVTSDSREKRDIRSLTDAEIAAGAAVAPMVYKWIAAVERKGDAARLHCTPIAQDVIAAFEAQGLNAFDYGVCCFDEWHEHNGERVEVDEDGLYHETVMQIDGETVEPDENGEYPAEAVETELTHETTRNDRYSLRETEALWFVQAATNARLDRLEANA